MERNLYEAAKVGDVKTVLTLLDLGISLNTKDEAGWTALMYSATHGRSEVVKILLEHGADTEVRCDAPFVHHGCLCPSAPNYQGCTALVMGAVCGNVKTIHLLVQAGANLCVRDVNGTTALVRAAQAGHCRTVKALLNCETAQNCRDTEEAMRSAAMAGYVSVVRLLLDSGVYVDARNREGETALMNAAINGHTAVVEALLNSGADINARNRYGETALTKAARLWGREETITLLRRSGARLTLFDAVMLDDVSAAIELLDTGTDIEALEKSGHTPLRLAAIGGSLEMVRLLIEKGADLNAKERWTGKSAYQWATKDAVRELLIRAEEEAE